MTWEKLDEYENTNAVNNWQYLLVCFIHLYFPTIYHALINSIYLLGVFIHG